MCKACPNCGSTNLISTSQGIMCKDCKTIVDTFAPVIQGDEE